jgi:hypothetical protein
MYGSNSRKAGLGLVVRGLSMKGPYTDEGMDYNGNKMGDDEFEPDMDEVGDYAGRLLMSAPIIQILHLQTDSYAKHKALNKLYDSLPDDADAVIEEFQGAYGVIPTYNTYVGYTANPVSFVEDLLKYVKMNRGVMGPCSSIQASIDTIITSIRSCLYKLKNLK